MRGRLGDRTAGQFARSYRGLAFLGFTLGTWLVGFAVAVLVLPVTPGLTVTGWVALVVGLVCTIAAVARLRTERARSAPNR
ncbi:hypothetical protein [Amycolatopsis rubida]|uniref:Uncharacterized protein n=1 Tax=Amycolatopsis rubida TaxID=112413 RepID=A0A1I5X4L9_9PSEU|nr:hypothetical protein [Amycolatopsis rubida]SFQ26864.1 hypothetical protein SAMN05421854_11028 [Amycolatopsis rubida]